MISKSKVVDDWGGARQVTDSPVKAKSNKPGVGHHHSDGTGAPKSAHHGHKVSKNAGGSKKLGKKAHTDAPSTVKPAVTVSEEPEDTTD
uniref:Uncharacterized protein n=1 Tax=Romanomermis culicivorax TaxID=13658 RepID=A0A915IBT9_ROMCU